MFFAIVEAKNLTEEETVNDYDRSPFEFYRKWSVTTTKSAEQLSSQDADRISSLEASINRLMEKLNEKEKKSKRKTPVKGKGKGKGKSSKAKQSPGIVANVTKFLKSTVGGSETASETSSIAGSVSSAGPSTRSRGQRKDQPQQEQQPLLDDQDGEEEEEEEDETDEEEEEVEDEPVTPLIPADKKDPKTTTTEYYLTKLQCIFNSQALGKF